MKKILITLFALMAVMAADAQEYLDFYKGGNIIRSVSTYDIDSIGFTTTTPPDIVFYRDDEIVYTYSMEDIDSIKVSHVDNEPFSYLGIVGFNQELYQKDFEVLATTTENNFKSFVSSLPKKDGTLLYYAVDEGLDMITAYPFPASVADAYVVTFTDGLDQGSLMMNWDYEDETEYQTAMSAKIGSTEVNGHPVTAYALGLRGPDVTDYAMFLSNLKKLATGDDKAVEVNSISDVQAQLQIIANYIISVTNRQAASLKIPGVSTGTRVRFVFDGAAPASSNIYIDGTFNRKELSLDNITYHGLRSNSGTSVQGTLSGIFVTFTFTGLQRTDGNGLVPMSNIKHYNMPSSSTSWQVNSEFSTANNTQTNVTHTGAVVLLLLDCSSSLGDTKFSNMKTYANDFIHRLAQNAEPLDVTAPTNVTGELDFVDDAFVVNVSWDAVRYAESYMVYRSSASNGTYSMVAEGVTSTSWTDNAPLANNYYKVYVVGHGLTSAASSASNNVSLSLSAPMNVTAELAGDDDAFVVHVSWDAVRYAESYKVYRSSGGTYTMVAEGVTTTSWTDENPLRKNYYKVMAVGHGLESVMSGCSNEIIAINPDNYQILEVNGVSFNMVKVAGGTFQMGATSEQGSDADSDEKPVHSVTLSDYYIGETEVTQALWYAVMGQKPTSDGSKWSSSYGLGDNYPAYYVSWEDCQTFITKLNQLTGMEFRLPTEAEWEFAARGGNSSQGYKYAGSNTVGDVAWYYDNSCGLGSSSPDYGTHPVATKSPNELGLYDMSGNVWEWCQDWYGSSYYSSSPQTNPTGPSSGSGRVLRGGSWNLNAGYCRVALRYYFTPSYRNYNLGLRLAL